MKVIINPSKVYGSIAAPPSKSMAHRLLICAALADGQSRIGGISGSEDIAATADCLRTLGARISIRDGAAYVTGIGCRLTGSADLADRCRVMNCRESGSTLRFMIPAAAAAGGRYLFRGSRRLMERPLSVYEDIFRERGPALERQTGADGAPEIAVSGILRSGEYMVDGGVSSQFISGLLFALPITEGDSRIIMAPPPESRPYIDMTIGAMRQFGAEADWVDESTLSVRGGQRYIPRDAETEGDWSNAAFLIAMGARVTGLDRQSLQGDKICAEYFRALDEGFAELDITDCPDLGPVLMAYAAMRDGCRLTGTRRLRIKESDRGEAMRQELARFGNAVRTEDNSITVGAGIRRPEEVLSGHNDHRIVMALTLLCLSTGGTIDGAEAVNKSFPDFFDRIRAAGACVTAAE